MAFTMQYQVYMLRILPVIVPFRTRSRNFLRPVNRIKHVVDIQGGVVLAVRSDNTIIIANDNPSLANTSQVQTGSTVNSIYLDIEVYGTTSGALSNIYMIVGKSPGGNITLPIPNGVGASDDKRYVFHQEMVMVQRVTPSNPRTLFKGVISIPRGYRRMGPNDVIVVTLLAPGVNFDFCIQVHYKEFR